MFTMSRRNLIRTGSAAALALAFDPRTTFSKTPDPLTVADASGLINLTMKQCMLDQKFLQQFDLDPKILDIADGSKIVAGLMGGGIDLSAMAGFGQIFPAIERGAPLKVLAGAALLPSLAVFSAKSNVVSMKDLIGRTVGVGAIGALLHQLMVALLLKDKLDPGQVKFVTIGSSADVLRAVSQGVVDAGPAEVAILDETERYHIHGVEGGNMSERLPEYTYQGSWTVQKAIDTERDKLVRTLAAFAKLYRFVQSPGAHDAFLGAYAKVSPNSGQKEREALWNYVQKYHPFAEGLVLGEERIAYMQNLNKRLKVQDKILPFEKVADMSLAQDALKLLA